MKTDWKATHKKEAVEFVKKFYRTSYDWRNSGSTSYHQKWDKYERNYHNIYDPVIKAKKEPWQCTMFVPYTVTNVETITSALFKILMGKRVPLKFDPREMGDEMQAKLQSDILLYEMQKANFDIEFYKVLKEAAIFGSGFMKFYWEKKYDNRRIQKPVRRGFGGTAKSILQGQFASPSDIVGFKQETENVIVEDRCRTECIHIRDIFIEPNSTDLRTVLHRQKISYNELLSMSKQKNADGKPLVDPDSVSELLMIHEGDKFEQDVMPLKYDQGTLDPSLIRPDYAKAHTVFEYWGPIPRKWIDLEMPENTASEKEKAEEVVEGKIMVASGDYYLASEPNPNPVMEPPFLQADYINCGQSYGKGIPQLIEGLQEEGNEIRNLRVDNVNLTMNKTFVVIESMLRDPKEVRSVPGGIIRLKGTAVTDARQGVLPLDIPPIDIGGYRETQEIAAQIQETTAANRVTLGTAGGANDVNQTLGGMELMRQAAYDRFSVYAYMFGNFLKKSAIKIMEQSYQNSSPERIHKILGEMPIEYLPNQFSPRWKLYKIIAPHEMLDMYDIIPADIFSMENKAQKSQSTASFIQLLAGSVQGFDPRPAFKRLGYYSDFTDEELNVILSGIPEGPVPTPLAMGQGVPSVTKMNPEKTGEMAPTSMPG